MQIFLSQELWIIDFFLLFNKSISKKANPSKLQIFSFFGLVILFWFFFYYYYFFIIYI